ncbi:MAG TPA: chorismate synthase [Deltaproteobacteria bacterium]|nr:chorismate synthase [Deltaproteobacteria bacterium]HXK47104.1 chorismate synthase [Deltaproteobacteria bacterium]
MLVFYTAGESHGRGVFAFLDGLPAGLRVDRGVIDADLARRQLGYGRGGRMAIEKDRVDVLSGIRGGLTLASPILLAVWNRDFENWKQFLDPWRIEAGRELHTPRPGHADLAGAVRYRHKDLRDVLERSSARETAGRVAAGGLLKSFLSALGIEVCSWVTRIGPIAYDGPFDLQASDASSVFCPDGKATGEMERAIDHAAADGDSLGGEFVVTASGLPPGIGSYTQWDKRLDALLTLHLMSIPAIKAVQIGAGIACGEKPGSLIHDPILPTRPKTRSSNNAGGLEGGMTNGEPVVIRCTMKPIPTLTRGLPTVDLRDGSPVQAGYERSDVCAVPAASVVGEAMAVIALSGAILDGFTQPSMDALADAFAEHRTYWESL